MQAAPEHPPVTSPGTGVVVQETLNNRADEIGQKVTLNPLDAITTDSVFPSCGSGGTEGPRAACDCGCGGKCGANRSAPPLVFALGTLDYDFGSDARRDSLVQAGLKAPDDPSEVVAFLVQHPESSSAITWLLNQENTPIYAIQPIGPYASQGYDLLRQFLHEQQTEKLVQISLPGYIVGKATLSTGQVVPSVAPELRGVSGWSTPKLLDAIGGPEPKIKTNA